MRRNDRQLTALETEEILNRCDYGVLSVIGENGYPYGIPVNYACADGKLYFHSTSRKSHKLDAIRKNSSVCFTVVEQHEIALDALSTDYASVIVFGCARILDEPDDKARAMASMMRVLGRGTVYAEAYDCGESAYVMVEITPEHMTGKARRKPLAP